MAIDIDPEETETAALAEIGAALSGAHVLEVGCGDGRLTWRYADRAGSVLGIDPKADTIARARASTPPRLQDRVTFRAIGLDALHAPPGCFDAVVLAWSL
jgi:ubiquinone/menaquinone biosynthesis C-methylase UbiE